MELVDVRARARLFPKHSLFFLYFSMQIYTDKHMDTQCLQIEHDS